MTNEIKATSQNELSADINVITAEINAYQRVAGEAIFEIGRRLKHVKENDLAHGEWAKWCESTIRIDRSTANKFIRVYDELEDVGTYPHLGLRALYEIATLPPEHREAEHVTSKGETKTPDEMTVKELRELKRQLKETEQAKEQAEQSAEIERRERERLEEENAELESQSKKIEQVYPDDYEKIKRENAEYRAKYGDSEGVRNIDDKKREKVYEEFAQELERLRLKYASIALDGANVDLYASANPEYASKINSFNDFWKMYVKTVSNDQIIIEVESV